MPDVDELAKVKRQVEAELLSRPGVTGVGVGFREVAGKPTDEIAIRVYVERKLRAGDVSSGALIPAEIHGHRTDVIERPAPSHTIMDKHVRPLACGVQIQCESPWENVAGATGPYVNYLPPPQRDKDGNILQQVPVGDYLLTCYHVLYPTDRKISNSRVHQPKPPNSIGGVEKNHRKYGDTVDAALVR